MKKEYISIVIGILALALVGQGIWLWKIYRANHANDFEIEELPEENSKSETINSKEIINSKSQTTITQLPNYPITSTELIWTSQLTSQSSKLISLKPGKTATLSATFTNTGTATWTPKNTFLQLMADDEADISPWYHPTWIGKKRVAAVKEATVGPETQGTFAFTITAPSVPGTYTIAFRPITQVNNKYTWLGANPHLAWTITIVQP